MAQLQGEGIREMMVNRLKRLREWVKPNPADTTLVQSLKMVYKVLALLVLVALSPAILVVLTFVFFATL